jgi:phospholipase D1/2
MTHEEPHRDGARTTRDRRPAVLQPSVNCWRVERANKVAVIVDAADYFSAAKAAILQARHHVFLIGWDFDWRIRLERREEMPEVPDELGAFLTHVVETRPGLRIFVLRWDMSFLRFPFRATFPLKILDWVSGQRLDMRADHHHPVGACHHQKIVVVDDSLAFCGGIDMTSHRWDTPNHEDDHPLRCDRGENYGPWHDATTCIDGDAARALGVLARERWRKACGEDIPRTPDVEPYWPEGVEPDFRNVDVAIARTQPMHGDDEEIREIEALYLAAIRSARRFIYIETQYFASHKIAEALGERLAERDGPEVVVINPKSAAGWLEEKVMGSARAHLLEDIEKADSHRRFRLYTPVTEGGDDIYVHAKVLVVDDRFLRVGSSNLNNRSMGFDTECDLAIEASSRAEEDAIRGIRTKLLAEHLGVDREAFAALDADLNRSLVGAIEHFRRPNGRSLIPFERPPLGDVEAAIAETSVLDPDGAETVDWTLLRRTASASRLLGGLAAAVVGGGALAALGVKLSGSIRRSRT